MEVPCCVGIVRVEASSAIKWVERSQNAQQDACAYKIADEKKTDVIKGT